MSDKEKRKKSRFQNFVESAYNDVVTALNLHDLIQIKENSKERESLEVVKINHMGAATEKLSKAIHEIYTAALIIPLLIHLQLNGLEAIDQNYLKELVNAVNDLRNAIKKQEKLLEDPKKLGHEAIKRSPLGEISKILIKIAVGKETEELRNFYTHIASFIDQVPVKRKYEDVVNLKEEYTKAVKLDYLKEELIDSIDRCYKQILAGSLSSECKQWDRETLQRIKENLDLIPTFLALIYIAFQYIIEFLLYSTYLEAAAGPLLRYKDEWTPDVENYISDVKKHQDELINVMRTIYTFLEKASENPEFEDMLNTFINFFLDLIQRIR